MSFKCVRYEDFSQTDIKGNFVAAAVAKYGACERPDQIANINRKYIACLTPTQLVVWTSKGKCKLQRFPLRDGELLENIAVDDEDCVVSTSHGSLLFSQVLINHFRRVSLSQSADAVNTPDGPPLRAGAPETAVLGAPARISSLHLRRRVALACSGPDLTVVHFEENEVQENEVQENEIHVEKSRPLGAWDVQHARVAQRDGTYYMIAASAVNNAEGHRMFAVATKTEGSDWTLHLRPMLVEHPGDVHQITPSGHVLVDMGDNDRLILDGITGNVLGAPFTHDLEQNSGIISRLFSIPDSGGLLEVASGAKYPDLNVLKYRDDGDPDKGEWKTIAYADFHGVEELSYELATHHLEVGDAGIVALLCSGGDDSHEQCSNPIDRVLWVQWSERSPRKKILNPRKHDEEARPLSEIVGQDFNDAKAPPLPPLEHLNLGLVQSMFRKAGLTTAFKAR